MKLGTATPTTPTTPQFPGMPDALDGSAAVVLSETAASEAAGAYPITPSTQMGEGWAAAVGAGVPNAFNRRLIFFEPEGEHAAAAVTAGLSMMGLRATNFSSGQGIAYMHESLYPAVGKRLTYVLNVAARAITKQGLNVHCGHDDYHAVDDTGFFQIFAKNVQEAADFTLIAHRIAELSLNPGISAQDGFLTSHVIESAVVPERELVKAYLGEPSDIIDSPTPAQRMVFGETRRRVPELMNLDYPAMVGVVQNQDSYQQGVAAQRPFYFDHVQPLADRAFEEFAALTGRRYARASGYKLDDADYVIAGQGSLIPNAEAVADYLRKERKLKVGVLNVSMFRPFPADCITALLKGKKAVVVLERVDQPLAVDAPLLREIRAAMGKGVENGRAKASVPHAGVTPLAPQDVPDFFSGCFGLGSRDLQPGDLIAAVENILDGGAQRRQFYLGIDFVRQGTKLPKMQIWQEQLLESYPHLPELSLATAGDINLLPDSATALRIHSVGGWGAITMGKNVTMTVFELCGLHVKANPKYGSEKKGQPTTFYAVFAKEPIRLNCELKHVNVVLSPDANVFRHSDPLAGLASGGAFVIQSGLSPQDLWNTLPADARRVIRDRKIRVFSLDAFKIAGEEATSQDLRYRMQGAAFMGAFFRATTLAKDAGLDEAKLFEGIRAQQVKKFGKLGDRIVEDNVRVIRRGYDEVRELDVATLTDAPAERKGAAGVPALVAGSHVEAGLADPGRFWETVCFPSKVGQDPLADPFVALSTIPASTSSFRDMTDIRFEVPDFVASKCTGCGQCWVQCPDSAIPAIVTQIDDALRAAFDIAEADGGAVDKVRQIAKNLGREVRKQMLGGDAFVTFADTVAAAYAPVVAKLDADNERKAQLDAEFARVLTVLRDMPLAKTQPFFDVPEGKTKGNGALLNILINPYTCKGCNLCVEVCPEKALVTVKQDDAKVASLRRGFQIWQKLPETPDDYINVFDINEGIGVLSSLLLKKQNYMSMAGGDGACMGCGEKTGIHLVLSAVNALMGPRVARHVQNLDALIGKLDHQARELLVADADLDSAAHARGGSVAVPLSDEKKQKLERLTDLVHGLKDLLWRYTEGPGGHGRAQMAMANSTGCSSVWASTFPLNPYPFPWVNHLFQDSPSVAIGLFEGHMRKMADGFALIRRAELELEDAYDPSVHDRFFQHFDWKEFSDAEFQLCPPIFAVGGDGAMFDIGFQNLSRLLASDKPIRVIVLDTQVYSNTGGQACTSGFLGEISDMATYGRDQHGKQEMRKELGFLAMAHRTAFVVQSSQASPSHLLNGVLRGLQSHHPAVFIIHTPCPPEHGLADDASAHAAKLALESRAVPFLVYDPSGGPTMADRLHLDGNPMLDETWPTYDLTYVDDAGAEQTMTLPLTTADWAATETRFSKHFRRVKRDDWNDDMVPFGEFVALPRDERDGKTPFIYVLDDTRRLGRVAVAPEIVMLAEERLDYWHTLREIAGLDVPDAVRDTVAGMVESEFELKMQALRDEYEAKLTDLKTRYPQVIARRLAEGLMGMAGNGGTVTDLLKSLPAPSALPPVAPAAAPAPAATAAAAPAAATPAAAAPAPAATAVAEAEDEGGLEAYIESARCTTCNECTNLNGKLFSYNAKKQAYVKDASAGTFQQLVLAAEKCPVSIIHPGTPRNPKEKDLDKWVKRAERFQ